MENFNGEASNSLSSGKGLLDSLKNSNEKKKFKTKEEILAKYFVPRKDKEIFRITPAIKGENCIEVAHFHVVPTLTAGGKVKKGTIIYCPAKNDPKVPKLDENGKPRLDEKGNPIMMDAPCPLCQKAKRKLAEQDPSIKNKKKEQLVTDAEKKIFEKNKQIFAEASQWEAKKFYIVRGVDKGIPKDGIKFWRFKHNYKKQGTLDKLLPILDDYMGNYNVHFADVKEGTDLIILMNDGEFNGRTFRQIQAITPRGKSTLCDDELILKGWLEDQTSWRDVFLPKKAPNITPFQYLQMVAQGCNPYWDDSDASNKRWVFPNHPELEALANTRNQNFDAEEEDYSDYEDNDLSNYNTPSINSITPEQVGTFKDNAVDVGQELTSAATQPQKTTQPQSSFLSGTHEEDDLPF